MISNVGVATIHTFTVVVWNERNRCFEDKAYSFQQIKFNFELLFSFWSKKNYLMRQNPHLPLKIFIRLVSDFSFAFCSPIYTSAPT